MRKSLLMMSVLAVVVAVAPACATKKMVRTEVGAVNEKVKSLSGSLEETQERTRKNEQRIGEVDQKADAAAKQAQAAGQAAQNAAGAANAVGGRVDEVVRNNARLIYQVSLSEDQGNFTFGKADLPDAAKARLDQMITQLKTDPKGVWIEIEGHTDNRGDAKTNEQIGLARAEAVKLYLHETHQVPLHKMNVISYGETKPIAPNTTRDGRAKNRRVVVRVLS